MLPVPTLVLLDLDQVTEPEFALFDLHAILGTLRVLTASSASFR